MASIGGLDLGYGSQLQLCRTNVLVIETDGSAAFSVAAAQSALNIAKQHYSAPLKPDYITFVASGAVTEGFSATSTPTEIAQNGVLTSLTEVPVAGDTHGATNSSQRGLAWESILNVGVVQINANDTATTDNLFENAGSAGVEDRDEFTVATDLQSTLMSAQFAAMDLTGGSSSTHARGGSDGKVMYLDISGVATDSNLLGGSALSAFDLTGVNSAATLNDLIAGVGGIIQITSVASVV
tara:strand:+ start:455 stop:1171 length:717 start_codon:yes stop_codon:yes gene_type:complete